MIINPIAPYDFERVLAKLGFDPLYEYLPAEQTLILLQSYKNEYLLISLKNIGDTQKPAIKLSSLVRDLSSTEQQELVEILSKRFGWQDKRLLTFYAALEKQGSPLSHVSHELQGLPLVLEDSLEACLFKTIISQQVHVKVARLVSYGLAEAFGASVEWQGKRYYAFPTSERLSELTVEELRQYKLSQRKAEYLLGLSQALTNGVVNLEELSQQSNDQVIETLCKLRGIGKWTAECFLLFGLGRQDLFPVGDLGIRKAIGQLEGWEEAPTQEQAAQWIKGKEAWGSYIALYLWERLGNMSLLTQKG